MDGPFSFSRTVEAIQSMALACVVYYAAVSGCAKAQQSSATAPESSEILPYAAVKQSDRLIIISRDKLQYIFPEAYPQHGVVVASGDFFSKEASWIAVDFDARTITGLNTTIKAGADGKQETVVEGKASRSLSVAEVNEIIRQANIVWNPPLRTSSVPDLPMIDATLEAIVLDGPSVTIDYGSSSRNDPLLDTIIKIKLPLQLHYGSTIHF